MAWEGVRRGEVAGGGGKAANTVSRQLSRMGEVGYFLPLFFSPSFSPFNPSLRFLFFKVRKSTRN